MDTNPFPDFVSGQYRIYKPTKPKLFSDTVALRKHARFVIELDEYGGYKFIDNTNSEELTIPLIVVLGYICDQDGKIYPASLLEIGLRRTRPYRASRMGKRNHVLQDRNSKYQLQKHQFELVYPKILECLELFLNETRSEWKNPDSWFVGSKLIERGVQLTVHKEDQMLCQALLREAVRYMDVAITPSSARFLNKQLGRYRTAVYTHAGAGITKAVDSMMASSYLKHPLWFEVVMRCVEKRTLLESALLNLHGFYNEPSLETELVFGRTLAEVPEAKDLFFWHTIDQPGKKKGDHAKDCLRFEVLFDRANPDKAFAALQDQTNIDLPDWPDEEWENKDYDQSDLDDIPF